MSKLIGITGHAGAGKSTLATMITTLVPGAFVYSWAEPIKEFAEAIYQFPKAWLHGPSELRSNVLEVGPTYWGEALNRFWSVGGEFSRDWLKACGMSPAGTTTGSAFVDWFDRVRHVCENDPSKLTPRYVCQQLGTEFGRTWIHEDVWINVGLDRVSRSTAPVAVISDVRFDNEGQAILNKGGEVWAVKRHTHAGRLDTHASEAGISKRFVTRTFPNFGSLESLRAQAGEALYLMGILNDEPR